MAAARVCCGVLAGNPYVVEYVTIQSIIDKIAAKSKNAAARYLDRGHFL